MIGYLAVFLAAAVVTAVTTPAVGWLATRLGAIDRPSDPRKVHRDPVPTLGGLAMVAGFVGALAVAWRIEAFADVFRDTSQPFGMLLGALAIAVVGVLDDTRTLPPTVKLAGQIVAAALPVFFGIQIVYAWFPGLEVVALAPDLGIPLTILAIVAMINAVNLIDGLDGLAAGVVGIAAAAFFVFALLAETRGIAEDLPNAAPMIAAIVVGLSLGFLVHNFHPARIFMGDTGSNLLGLLIGGAGIAYVGRTTAPSYANFVGSVPLLVPVLVLAVPFVDSLFAVVRRAYRRQPITVADKGHLHHLLIAFGHSHRRAVVTLYYWSAFVAFAAVGLAWTSLRVLAPWLGLLAVLGVGLTAAGLRGGGAGETADDQTERVRETG